MKWWALALLGGAVLAIWARRRVDKADVSEAWRVDHDRRAWGSGVDGINWKWPVNRR